jgi:glycosyltransferase involved in cell wall biosynthesis
MRRHFERRDQPWVLWHQDVYSLGVAAEAARVLPSSVAGVVSARVQRAEQAQVAAAGAVVAIGDGFVRQYERWGVPASHVSVIPNWAPLDELVPGDRDNAWARRHRLPEAPIRLLYAGTLGRKHNPLLLLDLLDTARTSGIEVVLTVVSEGVGAGALAAAAGNRPDVRVLGYQPAHEFADVLASADVVVALLEPDAAEFSVPSKVLSYLAAGRPAIALVPEGNPCAADVEAAGGFVAAPDPHGARAAAAWLVEIAKDPEGLRALGKRARAVAEERFDIDAIGDRFEAILHEVARRRRVRGAAAPVVVTGPGSPERLAG